MQYAECLHFLASLKILCDVSKLRVASSCTRRDISILERVATGLSTFHCAHTSRIVEVRCRFWPLQEEEAAWEEVWAQTGWPAWLDPASLPQEC